MIFSGISSQVAGLAAGVLLAAAPLFGQGVLTYEGDPIPADVERMYLVGLNFLKTTQNDDGSWPDNGGKQPGVVGLAVLSVLAHGDDPNHGPYAGMVERGIDFIIKSQRADNGYIGSSMYNHGFATLALAEAYGMLDNEKLGPALQKAVDLIVSSQARNSLGAWRYSPESRDADTTVSGAQVVALFAARNAGIAVPDEAFDKALKYYRQTQCPDGGFGYTSADQSSPPRSAIGTLVFALAKEKDSQEFKAGLKYLDQNTQTEYSGYMHYFMYYVAQALFHGDMQKWRNWNKVNIESQKSAQNADGSWQDSQGSCFGTATSLLSLALNYRYLPIYER